jgi:hypothetical protein
MDDDEPTRPIEDSLERPAPKREDWDAMLGKLLKPAHDGQREIEDTAL